MAVYGQQDSDSRYPSSKDAGHAIFQHGFNITTRKLPILKAEPIDRMTTKLGITPPEMIFGDNSVTIEHPASGWSIDFNAFDALDRVDKSGGSMLQVAHSKEWQSTREKKHEGITEIVKPFDWSYSTDYKGTVQSKYSTFEPSTTPIPLELLKRPDPIMFFDEVMLYEDEMADNGITLYSLKIRVMPSRLLLLGRFFMRLDNVLIRMRDTRVYIEFATGEVIREYVAKEENYEAVRQKLAMKGRDVPAQLRDPNNLNELLPTVDKTLEHPKQGLLKQRHKLDTAIRAQTCASTYFATQQLHTSSRLLQQPSPNPSKQTPSQSYAPPTQRSDTQPENPPSGGPPTPSTTAHKIAAETRRILPSVTETYVAYGSCEKLVKESARQAAYTIPQASDKSVPIPKTEDGEDLGVGESWWYQTLGLTPTFNTWAQVTFLHMYLLTVRMRCFPAEHAPTWHQHLLDQFFYTAEDKMVQLHNVHSRAIRNKYLKDLYVQWRGLLAGYDEGLIRGDAVLATAVWRNVFKADENVDCVGLGQVISYMRGVLRGLDTMSDDAIAGGEVVFGSPETEKPGVLRKSATMATLNERIEGDFKSLSAAPA